MSNIYDIRVSRELCRDVYPNKKSTKYMKTKRNRKVRRGKRTRRKEKRYKDYGEGLKYMIFDGKDHVFKYVGRSCIGD